MKDFVFVMNNQVIKESLLLVGLTREIYFYFQINMLV